MIQIKKTILTLVALLAVTTGAWADETLLLTIESKDNTSFWRGSQTFDDKVTVTFSEFVYNDGNTEGWYAAGGIASLLTVAGTNGYTITSCKFYTQNGTAANGYTVAGESPSVYLYQGYVYTDDSKSVSIGTLGIMKIEVYGGVAATDPNAVTAAEIKSDLYSGWSSLDERLIKASDLPGFQAVTENQAKSWTGVPSTGRVKLFYDFVADGNVKVVIFKNGVYDSSYEEEDLRCYDIYEDINYDGETKYFYTTGPAPSASTGPKVDWNKKSKTGTFTMPGGNVTLEPEYYPQAALTAAPTAINDVPATTDGAIVNAGTVANIGETETAQGTVMYYVSQTELDDAALLALAADQWTADVPTAQSLAQGQAYVYYYVRGNDSDNDDEIFSDGDILAANALTVTIAAEPTYAVTFAEGVNPEPPAEPEWTTSPNADVKKGQTVTVTYTGSKKVIGVKAEKKAAAPTWDGPIASEATAADIGKVVCAAGHLHDAKTAVPDGCTAVGILGKVTETGHGLILALKDAPSQEWNNINGWTSASYAGTTLKVLPDDDARDNLTSYTTLGETTVSNWAVAQIEDYDAIFKNLGSTKSNSGSMLYDDNVNDYITTGVGGTALSGEYWSAAEYEDYGLTYNNETWDAQKKTKSKKIRPVLGF